MNRKPVVPIIVIILCLIILAEFSALAVLLVRRTNSGTDQNTAVSAVLDINEEDTDEEAADLSASGNFYRKLSAGEDIHILVVGDSIGHGTGASDSEYIWYNLLSGDWNSTYGCACSVTDLAVNGNTAFGAYTMLEQAFSGSSDTDYDLVIVCDAQNDEDSDFALYYEALLRSIYRHWPDCTVLAILESSQREVTGKIRTVMALAEHYGILTVDTIDPFAENYDALCTDGIHPNDDGQAVYAQAVEDAVRAALAEGRAADRADADPMDKTVTVFDKSG